MQPIPSTALTSPSPPVGVDEFNSLAPKLAAEIGSGLLSTQDILDRYSLTPVQLRHIIQDSTFRSMVRDFKQSWNESLNAKERIRVKSQLAVEEALPIIYEIVLDPVLNPTARIDAFRRLVELADVAPRKDAPDSGEKFIVNISVPNVSESITIEAGDYGESE